MSKKIFSIIMIFAIIAAISVVALLGVDFTDTKGILDKNVLLGGDLVDRYVISYTPSDESVTDDSLNSTLDLIKQRLEILDYIDAKAEINDGKIVVTIPSKNSEEDISAANTIGTKGILTFVDNTGETVVQNSAIDKLEITKTANSEYPYAITFNFTDSGLSFYTATSKIVDETHVNAGTNYLVALLDTSMVTGSYFSEASYQPYASFPIEKSAKADAENLVEFINLGQIPLTLTNEAEYVSPSLGSSALCIALISFAALALILLLVYLVIYKSLVVCAFLTLTSYAATVLFFIWSFELFVSLYTIIAYAVVLLLLASLLFSVFKKTRCNTSAGKTPAFAAVDAMNSMRSKALIILGAVFVISFILWNACNGLVAVISTAVFNASFCAILAYFVTCRLSITSCAPSAQNKA